MSESEWSIVGMFIAGTLCAVCGIAGLILIAIGILKPDTTDDRIRRVFEEEADHGR